MAKSYDFEKFEDIEIYPPEVSATGNNAYHHRCDTVGHEAPYAACLRKIKDVKEKTLPSIYATCGTEIRRDTCPAQAMRKQELAEGKAMFFINRKKMREFYQGDDALAAPEPTRAWTPPSRGKLKAKPVPSVPVVPKPTTPAFTGNDFADAINYVLTSGAKSPMTTNSSAPAATMSALPARVAGMTMLEIARLRASQKVSQ